MTNNYDESAAYEGFYVIWEQLTLRLQVHVITPSSSSLLQRSKRSMSKKIDSHLGKIKTH